MVKNHWFKFIILYLGATILCLSQLKIVPVFDEISSSLGITMSQTSLLTSVFTFSALFLAIPAGTLISKFGARKMSLFVMFCLVLGNVLGGFSNNFVLLLLSRIIEGVSFSMIMLISMVFISHWFPKGRSGLPIGIFGTFSALGTMISMPLFKTIYMSFGLSGLWFLMAGLSLLGFIGFYFFFEEPQSKSSRSEDKNNATLKEALGDKNVWLLALAMFCMTFVLYTYITIYPKIFADVYGIESGKSNSLYGLFGLFGVPFGFVAGIIIDKTKRPAVLGMLSFLVLSISCFFTTRVTASTLVIQIFILSACIMLASSSISIAVPTTVKRPALIGYTFSVIYLFYYIGVFIGSPIVSLVIEKTSWNGGILLLTAMSLLATLLMVYLNHRSKITIT